MPIDPNADELPDIAGLRPIKSRTVVRRELAATFTGDPHPLLESEGELLRIADGRFGLGPRVTSLVEYIDRCVRRMAKKLRAAPHQFPALAEADVAHRCGCALGFSHVACMQYGSALQGRKLE